MSPSAAALSSMCLFFARFMEGEELPQEVEKELFHFLERFAETNFLERWRTISAFKKRAQKENVEDYSHILNILKK